MAKGASVLLALITPGVALVELQQWGPVLLTLAALCGGALATAIAAFHKATANTARIARVERATPKRSTDTRSALGRPSASAMPLATGRAAIVETIATLPGDADS